MTVLALLAIVAFICTIVAALGKCPLWIPVILLCIIVLMQNAGVIHL
jgi:hypothetical protein